ncbi:MULTISPECIES: hypothetical protein [Entomomonas]|uniref:Uncharacterized protein n=1 Tax=Entomomonas asaccharolytica TaxID=2785331 RepID=A0A974NHJ6_9GAMM|nr:MULTISPECIES: hypothetical protein [Entomomonas]QQP86876.1 hypothetical protein JHT90_06435 [Entomomonas asaccharolytica]UYZ83506.1 hypothetical protein MTZ49_13020 [Entomomonas sp. E2T0]
MIVFKQSNKKLKPYRLRFYGCQDKHDQDKEIIIEGVIRHLSYVDYKNHYINVSFLNLDWYLLGLEVLSFNPLSSDALPNTLVGIFDRRKGGYFIKGQYFKYLEQK